MKILDRLPFSETRSEVWTPDRLATVKPYQIIVTVSLAVRELIEPILGLRGLVDNNLKLIIDGKRREVSLKTPGWI